ncbi:serine/threonine protein kinase [Persicimonas caeni]|nr:serine/threonine-protein kinase [Persicimonas caeni]
MSMICANCGAHSDAQDACESCGQSPLLRERYVLRQVLGEGASGTTYLARDTQAAVDVAIKELAFHRVDSFKAHELFEREAAVLCRLDHPGVPSFFDHFAAGEGKALRFYLVMEFIEGHSLEEELSQRQFDQEEVLAILEELGEVTGYLHSLSPPVIHRDIKPSNVMRRADGSLVLIDFGSVRDALEPEDAGSTIAGTIGYMAPEQLRGLATPASDVYALATCALHLLTRKPPVELLDAQNQLRWEGLTKQSAALTHLLEHMLSGDPSARPGDGHALVRTVQRARQAPRPQPKASPVEHRERRQGRKVVLFAVLGVVLMVLGMALSGWLLMSGTPDPPSDAFAPPKLDFEPVPTPIEANRPFERRPPDIGHIEVPTLERDDASHEGTGAPRR